MQSKNKSFINGFSKGLDMFHQDGPGTMKQS